jgi:hypothetical protein
MQIFVKLDIGALLQFVEQIQIWLKFEKNIGHFT